MIDLKKLQDRFDSLFEQETEDSFNKWLEDKTKREVTTYLGMGEIEIMKTKHPILPKDLLIMPVKVCFGDTENNIAGNTQYAMAA